MSLVRAVQNLKYLIYKTQESIKSLRQLII